MSIENNISQKNINPIISLYKEGKFEYALKKLSNLITINLNEPFLYNLRGMIEIKLCHFEESIKSFNKAIELNSNYVEAYNNLGTSFINLGEFNKAIEKLKIALKLKSDYVNAYNNLASAYSDLGQYEEAIKYFYEVIKIEPNYPGAKENIIKVLTFYNSNNSIKNEILETDNLLKKSKYNLTDINKIENKDIIEFYNKSNLITLNKLNNLKYNFTQIWRRNTIDLNCSRHFDVFRNFNVIPKFCFECFKVQIELQTVLDLIKLYFVFNNIEFGENKSRKCLVEMRSKGFGTYKGLIYCTGYNDAKKIYEKISKVLKVSLKNKFSIKIRRGCTEFGDAYPEYKNLSKPVNEFMKYKEEWKEKEDIIDKKFPTKNRINQRILNNTLKGISLNDFLIIRNWIMYAKKINDLSYKLIDKDIVVSDYMNIEIEKQLSHRVNEFKKLSIDL